MTDNNTQKPISVLFVCLGNICRSPMAEGVFRHLTAKDSRNFDVDSCGTGAYHIGSSPDPRTMSTLAAHGITTYSHAARQFDSPDDFYAFDYIFPMDSENLSHLRRLRTREAARRKRDGSGGATGEEGMGTLVLWGAYGGKSEREEVVDPYYGASGGFETCYEQMGRFTKGFLQALEGGGKL